MKINFKPSTIYPLILGIVIIALVFSVVVKNTPDAPVNPKAPQGNMPNDDIHKNMGKDPSGTNVSSEILHQIEKLGKVVEANPTDTAKIREYADILLQSHKPDKATEQYEKILKIDPKRKDILIALSYGAYILQDFDKATGYTKRILKFLPNDPEANYNLGAIEAMKGNNAEAKRIWAEVAKKNPGTPIATSATESIKKINESEKVPATK